MYDSCFIANHPSAPYTLRWVFLGVGGSGDNGEIVKKHFTDNNKGETKLPHFTNNSEEGVEKIEEEYISDPEVINLPCHICGNTPSAFWDDKAKGKPICSDCLRNK